MSYLKPAGEYAESAYEMVDSKPDRATVFAILALASAMNRLAEACERSQS
ncbi:hypothetical protein ACBJ59_10365 [Nonomuraea sp. MTCD27]